MAIQLFDPHSLESARKHFGSYDKVAEALALDPNALRSRIYRANRKGVCLTFSRPESVLLDIRSGGVLHFLDLNTDHHPGDEELKALLTEFHQRELDL